MNNGLELTVLDLLDCSAIQVSPRSGGKLLAANILNRWFISKGVWTPWKRVGMGDNNIFGRKLLFTQWATWDKSPYTGP